MPGFGTKPRRSAFETRGLVPNPDNPDPTVPTPQPPERLGDDPEDLRPVGTDECDVDAPGDHRSLGLAQRRCLAHGPLLAALAVELHHHWFRAHIGHQHPFHATAPFRLSRSLQ